MVTGWRMMSNQSKFRYIIFEDYKYVVERDGISIEISGKEIIDRLFDSLYIDNQSSVVGS